MIEAIPRVAKLSVEAFRELHLIPRIPVVMSDVVGDWPAMRWTPEMFKDRFGDRTFIADEYSDDEAEVRMADYIDHIRAAETFRWNKRLPYLRGLSVFGDLPELLSEFEIPPHFQPNWLSRWPVAALLSPHVRCWADLFIGPRGAGFPNLHYDTYMTHNWFCQIYGEKKFWAFRQDQRPFLYEDPDGLSDSMLEEFPPDPERFPDFEKATRYEFVLGPGELLFIPAGTWHTTTMLSTSISVSGNFVNETNFDDFERHIAAHAECPFEGLKQPWIRSAMNLSNRLVDGIGGPPRRAFRYNKWPPVLWRRLRLLEQRMKRNGG